MAETKQNLQETPVIAKLFGITERRVQQLAKDGILPVAGKRPYKFDLLPTIQAYIRHLNDRLASKDKGEQYSTAEFDKLRAEANIKQSKDKIAEMQLKELEGKMHRSEDVEAITTDLVFTIRNVERRREYMNAFRAKANAFQISQTALFACDAEGRFTQVNDTFLQMFGLEDEEDAPVPEAPGDAGPQE